MNKYVKMYIHRGLIFAGLGPIVAGLVMLILEKSGTDISLGGTEILVAIVSSFLCAFVHAGSSVFPVIEHWGKVKAMFWQFSTLYVAYLSMYWINGWMPMQPKIVTVFTVSFLGGFLLLWLIIYLIVNATTKKMNSKLHKMSE